MSLRPCPICKREISINASICPSCGESDPLRNERQYDFERAKDKLRRDSGTPLKLSDSEELESQNVIYKLIGEKNFFKAIYEDSKRYGLKPIHSEKRVFKMAREMGFEEDVTLYITKREKLNSQVMKITLVVLLVSLILFFILY
jgi:hypothetical protein